MADLEDAIFKQNVPGRWSSHEPKGIDIRHHDDDCDGGRIEPVVEDVEEGTAPMTEEEALFNHAKYLANENVPEPIRRGILAERMKKGKTGVKGVLADYKAHCQMEKAHQVAKAQHRQAILTRMAEGHKLSAEESAKYLINNHDENIPGNGEEDDNDDDDEEFLEEFRKKRLQEMMQKSNKPTFGTVKEVCTADFLEEVDNEDSRVIVVVHLYETSVQSCIRMNRFLEEMCRTMPEMKFLRMSASSNEIEVDRLTLPILNIYRGGNCETVLAGIAEELGEYFTREDVEWLLESKLQEAGLN